jgi:hypothetical protein
VDLGEVKRLLLARDFASAKASGQDRETDFAQSLVDSHALQAETVSRLLPSDGSVLNLGIGLGLDAMRLRVAGLGVRAHDSDPFEGPDGVGQWDALLTVDSSIQRDFVDLFDRARDCLRSDATLVVVDAFFITDANRSDPPNAPTLLPTFLALAARAGFEVREQVNLDAIAIADAEWFAAAIERHQPFLLGECGLKPSSLDALRAAVKGKLTNYAAGRVGYRAVQLRMLAKPSWRVRRITDQPGGGSVPMRELFSNVFGKSMSAAQWQWKYGAGNGFNIGIWEANDNKLVAHCGGVRRPCVWQGAVMHTGFIGDVMVAPECRGITEQPGPFSLATASYLEHVGYGTPHLLVVGFPSLRHFTLGARRGFYANVGSIGELSWPALEVSRSLRHKVREIDLDDATSLRLVEQAWEAMRASMPTELIIGVRDAKYFQHRYARHPDNKYATYAVQNRLTRKLTGVLVIAIDANKRCELMDVIGHLDHLPTLLLQARRIAATLGQAQLVMWASSILTQYLGGDASVSDLGIAIGANTWTPGPGPDELMDKWWLTGGDADFK